MKQKINYYEPIWKIHKIHYTDKTTTVFNSVYDFHEFSIVVTDQK